LKARRYVGEASHIKINDYKMHIILTSSVPVPLFD